MAHSIHIALLTAASMALAFTVLGCGSGNGGETHHGSAEPGSTQSHKGAVQGHQHGHDPSHAHHDGDGSPHEHHEKAAGEETSQDTCPVMGGVIDPDVFVEHEGHRIYLCCRRCIDKFKADPDKYLARPSGHEEKGCCPSMRSDVSG